MFCSAFGPTGGRPPMKSTIQGCRCSAARALRADACRSGAPVAAQLRDDHPLGHQRVDHQVKQMVLVGHVPVQRHRARLEYLGDPPHAHRVRRPRRPRSRSPRLHDLGTGQGLLFSPASRARAVAPRGLLAHHLVPPGRRGSGGRDSGRNGGQRGCPRRSRPRCAGLAPGARGPARRLPVQPAAGQPSAARGRAAASAGRPAGWPGRAAAVPGRPSPAAPGRHAGCSWSACWRSRSACAPRFGTLPPALLLA